jgi:predicted phage tail protein
MVLNWVAMPGAQSYRIYQTTPDQPLNFTVVQTVNQLTGSLITNATVAGLLPGRTYLFQVRAVGPNGQESPAPAAPIIAGGVFGQSPLPAPAGLVVSNPTGNAVTLNWAAIPGAASYQVLQATSAGGPFLPASTTPVTGSSVTVTGLTAGAPYYFQVVAIDPSGAATGPSNTVSTTTTTTTALTPPTGVAATTTTSNTATLSWTVSTGAASYRVMFGTALGGPFNAATVTNATSTGATVTGLNPSTPYFFEVIAVDAAGNASAPSAVANGITTP